MKYGCSKNQFVEVREGRISAADGIRSPQALKSGGNHRSSLLRREEFGARHVFWNTHRSLWIDLRFFGICRHGKYTYHSKSLYFTTSG